MKTKLLLTILISLIINTFGLAQAPQAFKYQTVVRDHQSHLLIDRNVSFRIEIITGSSSGPVVYTEIHNVITNEVGLVSFEVGNGIPVSGNFANINWAEGPYFLGVGFDPSWGNFYQMMGVTQLLSVPYALHAKTVEFVEYSETDPLFQASAASVVTGQQIESWQLAYSWGDHAEAGYLTAFTELDPTWGGEASVTGNIGRMGSVGIGMIAPVFKLDVSEDARIFGVRVGRGSGSQITNTVIGNYSLSNNTSGRFNSAFGYQALFANTTGENNTVLGANAMKNNLTGSDNTTVGHHALNRNMYGSGNTAIGANALNTNLANSRSTAIGFEAMRYADRRTTGRETFNTAVGYQALRGSFNTESNTGQFNTAIGDQALLVNTSGSMNTAVGVQALSKTDQRNRNTAVGYRAMHNMKGGAGDISNTAIGCEALSGLTTNSGGFNTAIGDKAMLSNTSGSQNTALGAFAMQVNTTGERNTCVGLNTLLANSSGENNVAMGHSSMLLNTTGSQNTAIGRRTMVSNTTGQYNTALGDYAFSTGAAYNNSTAIGNGALINANNKIRFGNTAVEVIEGQVPYSIPGDGRFMNNISEDVAGLNFVMRLRPVSFTFDTKRFDEFRLHNVADSIRHELLLSSDYSRSSPVIQMGFIAQEVLDAAKASEFSFSGVTEPKDETGNYNIAYSMFAVPLVKAIQEQQEMILHLRKEVEMLKSILEGYESD